MASHFEEYQHLVDNFNIKYGLNFSFEDYETNQLRHHNIAKNFNNGNKSATTTENNLYRGTLLNLYKEYAEKTVLGRSDDSEDLSNEDVKSPSDFVKDFESLMNTYRDYCKEIGRTSPSKYGGWKSGIEIMNAMKGKVEEIGSGENGLIDKTEYVKKEYLAGRMPLRKMRADLENMKSNINPSYEEYSRAIVYLRAIDKVRKERSFLAKLNPFNWARIRAEKRDYIALNNFIVQEGEKYPQSYDVAAQRADAKASLDAIKESIDESIERIQDLEREKELEKAQKKENVNFGNDLKENTNDLKKSEKVEHIAPVNKEKTID